MNEIIGFTDQQRWQNTFNAVWTHSEQMTERSTKNGLCAYRGKNGNRCFIGALIPDSLYKQRFDDPRHDSSAKLLMQKKWGVNVKEFFETEGYSVQVHFLDRLQRDHDNHFETRQASLRQTAALFGLTIPV